MKNKFHTPMSNSSALNKSESSSKQLMLWLSFYFFFLNLNGFMFKKIMYHQVQQIGELDFIWVGINQFLLITMHILNEAILFVFGQQKVWEGV